MKNFLWVALVSGVVLTGQGQTALVWTNFQAGAQLGTAENWTPNQTPGFSSILQVGTNFSGAPLTQQADLSSGDVSANRLYVGGNLGVTGVVHMTGGTLTVNAPKDDTIEVGHGTWGNAGVGYFILDGGTVSTTNALGIANYADGYFIQNGGQLIITMPGGMSGGWALGRNPGPTQAKARQWLNDGYFELGAGGSANIGLDAPGYFYMTNTLGNPLMMVRRGLQVGRKTAGPGYMYQSSGTIQFENGASLTLGSELGSGGYGYYQLDGGVFTNVSSAFYVAVKNTATVPMDAGWQAEFVQNGGMAFISGLTAANNLGCKARLEINNGLFSSAGEISVGNNGYAEMTINGGRIENRSNTGFSVGRNTTGTGVVWQTGGTLSVSNVFYMGYVSAASKGTYTMTGGKISISGDCVIGEKGSGDFALGGNGEVLAYKSVFLGNQAGSSGSMVLSGGMLSVSNTSYVGNYGTGSLTIRENGQFFLPMGSKHLYVGRYSGSTGMVIQTGGSFRGSDNVYLALSAGSVAGWTISGGTMTNGQSFYNGCMDTSSTASAFFKIIGGAASIRVRNYETKLDGTTYFRIWTNGLSTIWTDNKVAFKGGKLDVAPYCGIGLLPTNRYVLLDTGLWEYTNIGGTNGIFNVALVGRECAATLANGYKVSATVLNYGKDAGITTPVTKGWCAVDFANAPTTGMPVSLRLDYGASGKTKADVKAFLETAGYSSIYPSNGATGNFDLIATVPVPAGTSGCFAFDFTDLSPEITVAGLRFKEETQGGTTLILY